MGTSQSPLPPGLQSKVKQHGVACRKDRFTTDPEHSYPNIQVYVITYVATTVWLQCGRAPSQESIFIVNWCNLQMVVNVHMFCTTTFYY